jgi:hypothetical protein
MKGIQNITSHEPLFCPFNYDDFVIPKAQYLPKKKLLQGTSIQAIICPNPYHKPKKPVNNFSDNRIIRKPIIVKTKKRGNEVLWV